MEIGIERLVEANAAGTVVIDVREPEEFEAGHVPGALSVPLGELADRMGELRGHPRLHVICASGNRSLQAVRWLRANGFDAVSVAGGTAAWQAAGHPVDCGRGGPTVPG